MLQFFYISLPPVSNNFLQFSCLEFPPNIAITEEFWMRKHDDDCWGLWGATRKCREMNRGVSHGESDAEAEEKTEEVERMYEVWGTHLSHDSHHNQQWIVDIGSHILTSAQIKYFGYFFKTSSVLLSISRMAIPSSSYFWVSNPFFSIHSTTFHHQSGAGVVSW